MNRFVFLSLIFGFLVQPIYANTQSEGSNVRHGFGYDLLHGFDCKYSDLSVSCVLNITREQLQKVVRQQFIENGGAISDDTKVADVPMHLQLFGPTIIMRPDHRIGMALNVNLRKVKLTPDHKLSDAAKIVHDLVPDVVKFRDLQVVGDLHYVTSTGELFYRNTKIVDYHIEGEGQNFVEKYEEALLAALSEVIRPTLERKPIYKLTGIEGELARLGLKGISVKGSKSIKEGRLELHMLFAL